MQHYGNIRIQPRKSHGRSSRPTEGTTRRRCLWSTVQKYRTRRVRQQKRNNNVILNGNLCRMKIKNVNVSLQVCLPRCSIHRVVTNYHDHIMTGHLGQNRTLERLTKRFHWNGIEKDIRAYIRSCLSYQMRKTIPYKPAGFISYIEADYLFHKVGIDILGPFPDTPKNTSSSRYIV